MEIKKLTKKQLNEALILIEAPVTGDAAAQNTAKGDAALDRVEKRMRSFGVHSIPSLAGIMTVEQLAIEPFKFTFILQDPNDQQEAFNLPSPIIINSLAKVNNMNPFTLDLIIKPNPKIIQMAFNNKEMITNLPGTKKNIGALKTEGGQEKGKFYNVSFNEDIYEFLKNLKEESTGNTKVTTCDELEVGMEVSHIDYPGGVFIVKNKTSKKSSDPVIQDTVQLQRKGNDGTKGLTYVKCSKLTPLNQTVKEEEVTEIPTNFIKGNRNMQLTYLATTFIPKGQDLWSALNLKKGTVLPGGFFDAALGQGNVDSDRYLKAFYQHLVKENSFNKPINQGAWLGKVHSTQNLNQIKWVRNTRKNVGPFVKGLSKEFPEFKIGDRAEAKTTAPGARGEAMGTPGMENASILPKYNLIQEGTPNLGALAQQAGFDPRLFMKNLPQFMQMISMMYYGLKGEKLPYDASAVLKTCKKYGCVAKKSAGIKQAKSDNYKLKGTDYMTVESIVDSVVNTFLLEADNIPQTNQSNSEGGAQQKTEGFKARIYAKAITLGPKATKRREGNDSDGTGGKTPNWNGTLEGLPKKGQIVNVNMEITEEQLGELNSQQYQAIKEILTAIHTTNGKWGNVLIRPSEQKSKDFVLEFPNLNGQARALVCTPPTGSDLRKRTAVVVGVNAGGNSIIKTPFSVYITIY